MRAAIIESGIVINVAETNADFAMEQNWIVSDVAKIGDTWDGKTFISPPEPEAMPTVDTTKEELLEQLQTLQLQIAALAE